MLDKLRSTLSAMQELLERKEYERFLREFMTDCAHLDADKLAELIEACESSGEELQRLLQWVETAEPHTSSTDQCVVFDLRQESFLRPGIAFLWDAQCARFFLCNKQISFDVPSEPSEECRRVTRMCADRRVDPVQLSHQVNAYLETRGQPAYFRFEPLDSDRTMARLAELEAEFHIFFPDDYRRFLVEHGLLSMAGGDQAMFSPFQTDHEGIAAKTQEMRAYVCGKAYPDSLSHQVKAAASRAVAFFCDEASDGLEMFVFYPDDDHAAAKVRMFDEGDFRTFIGKATSCTYVQARGVSFSSFLRGLVVENVKLLINNFDIE